MSRIFHTVLFCFVFAMTHAQVKWSDTYEGSESDAQFIVANQQHKILLVNKKSGFLFAKDKWYVQVYDDRSLHQLNETPFVFAENEIFDGTLSLRGNNYLLAETFHKSTKSLRAYQLDTNGKSTPLTQPLALLSKVNYRSDFEIHTLINTDTSQLCIYHVHPELVEKTLAVSRFDERLQKLNEYRLLLPFGEKEFHFLDAISTTNEAAFLIKVGDDDKLRLFSNRTYSYFIFKVNWFTGETTTTKINLKARSVIIGSAFFTDKNNSIGICGFQKFFTDKNDPITSPFITQFHNAGASRNVEDYTDDYVQPSFQMNLVKDDNPYEYVPLMARSDKDGTVTLVNEKFYLETSCITDMRSGLQRCNYYYHFDNIEAYTFLPSLEAKKRFIIEKRQLSTNDEGYYSGTLSGYFHNTYYFLYADSKKNEQLYNKVSGTSKEGDIGYMNAPRKSNVVLASFDQNGQLTRKILFNNADAKTIFSARKSMITADGKIIFYCKKNNKFRIGLLELH